MSSGQEVGSPGVMDTHLEEDEDLSCPSDESQLDADLSIGPDDGNGYGLMNNPSNNSNYGSVGLGDHNEIELDTNVKLNTTEETPLLSDINKHMPCSRDNHQNQSQSQQQPFTLETSHLNFFSSLTFQWFAPLLKLGNSKEQLDPEDLELLPLPPSCQTKNVSKAFEFYWNNETETYKRNSNSNSNSKKHKFTPSVARCLARAYGAEFLRAGILKLIHDMCVFVGPIVLNGLILFLRDPKAPLRTGLLLTASVTVSQTIMSFCLRHYFFKCYMVGLRMRTAMVVQVYKKALVLSSAERQRRTTGEIINFMTVDAQRIQELTNYLHAIWYSIIQIFLSIYFLW